MPVDTTDLVDAFDDLGYTLEDPKVIDRLCSLCDMYGVDEIKVSCEYLAFAKNKKISAPTLDIIEQFDQSVLSGLKSKIKENAKNDIYDSTNINELLLDNDEDDVLDSYSTPKSSAKTTAKRQITPENNTGFNKRRLGTSTNDALNDTFSPDSLSHTPQTQGKKYGARDNAGKVLIRYGETSTKQTWTNTSDFYQPEINIKYAKKSFPRDYRYMFERLREKAGFIDETICYIGDELKEMHKLEEPTGFGPDVNNDPFPTLGRIFCDSEGRLNANSLLLQGTQDLSRGRALPLDLSKLKDYSVFPGQVIHSAVTNPTGSKLVAHNLSCDATPKLAAFTTKLMQNDTIQVVMASGPFTTNDSLAYEPFRDLLDYIGKNRPHVVILLGPFIDTKQPLIDECNTNGESFDEIFNRLIAMIHSLLEDLPMTQFILQPSTRDVHHRFIYPTPEFEIDHPRIKSVPDPALVSVDGVIFGFTSTDILFHLGKEEISYPPRSGDRMRRLATHLLQQRSFYPLYPPSEEINMDLEQLESLAKLEVQPHVLILPSDLLHFFKDINGGLVINPQRLTKGAGGGVFARLAIQAHTDDFTKHVNAEIVRI